MLLPPSEDTALPIATTHKPVDLLAIQTLRPCAISQAVALFEVDAMLVQQVQALLFVVYQNRMSPKNMVGRDGFTDRRYRAPSEDPSCTCMNVRKHEV